MDTITLAKIDVFNTKILNNDNIQEIYKHENRPLIITDLLDISEFKIALHQDLIIIYKKYPIIMTFTIQDPFHIMMENY